MAYVGCSSTSPPRGQRNVFLDPRLLHKQLARRTWFGFGFWLLTITCVIIVAIIVAITIIITIIIIITITILSREAAKNPAALLQMNTAGMDSVLKALQVVVDATYDDEFPIMFLWLSYECPMRVL